MEDLKPGRPGLYEQTSFNCVDFRLRSAEHSSELDALLSLARKFAPKGLLVVIYATELRLFNAHSAIVYALRVPMRIRRSLPIHLITIIDKIQPLSLVEMEFAITTNQRYFISHCVRYDKMV